jgi:hypothetical protein
VINNTKNDKNFITAQEQRLSKYTNKALCDLLFEKILNGDQSIRDVPDICSYVEIDFLVLFEKLLLKIESLDDNSELCQKLITTAHYFNESSTLYQSYVMFRMTEYWPISSASMKTKLLGALYVNGKFNAFNMYLQQKHPMNLAGSVVDMYEFNVITTILICNKLLRLKNPTVDAPPLLPYINALLTHHAPLTCVKSKVPEFHEYKISKKSSSVVDVFKQKQSGKMDVLVSKMTKISNEFSLIVEHFASIRNILEWTLEVYVSDWLFLKCLADHFSAEECLLALTRIICIEPHSIVMIPGGQDQLDIISLFSDQVSLQKSLKGFQKIVDEHANLSEKLCTRILAVWVDQSTHHDFSSFFNIINLFKGYVINRLKELPSDEITRSVDRLIRGVITQKANLQLKNLTVRTPEGLLVQSYNLAAIILQSLKPVTQDDCMRPLRLMLWFIDLQEYPISQKASQAKIILDYLSELFENESLAQSIKKAPHYEDVIQCLLNIFAKDKAPHYEDDIQRLINIFAKDTQNKITAELWAHQFGIGCIDNNSQLETEIDETHTDCIERQEQDLKPDERLTMHLLGLLIGVLGISAVAIAFVLDNTSRKIMVSVGVGLTLMGTGFFKIARDEENRFLEDSIVNNKAPD